MPKIKVHEKALAHLSRGLYRSPASALRELVSNAWDANATRVRISTNFPNFLQLSVEDNGEGFSKDEFVSLMEGGIGNSQKTVTPRKMLNARRVIGRLGIGMLGIAQVCMSFIVISTTNDGRSFKARVRLYDLLKQKLDQNDEEVLQQTELAGGEPYIEVDVGDYDFEPVTDKMPNAGTRIIADELHPTFIRSFQESVRHPEFKTVPADWAKAAKALSKVRSLQEMGDYWRLLWELSAACPVQYVSERSAPKGLVREEQRRLEKHKFSLYVDGIELRKPVNLSGNLYGYSTMRLEPHEELIYGQKLSFHGYIVIQEGMQLKPNELRGIMIRINDVAIGYYDPSLLDYRYNEGPRAKWLTAEVFVDEGLADALNIDRDSFNRFHPHFRALQRQVHQVLHEKIFPDTYKQIEVRSTARRTKKEGERTDLLHQVVTKSTGKQLKIRVSDKVKVAASKEMPVVKVRNEEKNINVELPQELEIKTANQQLAKSILAIFELAIQEKSRQKQRDVFTRMLLDLLKRW